MKTFSKKFTILFLSLFLTIINSSAQNILFECYLDFTGPSECISPELEQGNYILELSGTFCSGSCWGNNTSDAAFNINHPYAENAEIPQPNFSMDMESILTLKMTILVKHIVQLMMNIILIMFIIIILPLMEVLNPYMD